MNNSYPVFKMEQVSKSYQSSEGNLVKALSEVSMEVSRGDCVVIVGPSGSGKSTLLHVMAGIEPPDSGEVYLNNKSLYAMSSGALTRFRNRSVGMIFQNYQLMADLSAIENVMLPSIIKSPFSKKKIILRAELLLDSIGLLDRRKHYPGELSGGEAQRVGIARALMNDPDILLCDEPTGNLDRENSKIIAQQLKKLSDKWEKTVLIVTHDDKITSIASQSFCLTDGMIEK